MASSTSRLVGLGHLQISALQPLCDEFITKSLNAFGNPSAFHSHVKNFDINSEFDEKEQSLRPCGIAILKLLRHLCLRIQDHKATPSFIASRLNDLLALAKEKFYAFPYKDVPFCWRELFRVASFMKICVLATQHTWVPECKSAPFEERVIDEIVQIVDMAIIMAGPFVSKTVQNTIQDLLELLEKINKIFSDRNLSEDNDVQDPPSSKRRKTDHTSSIADQFPASSVFIPTISKPVPELVNPSFAKFERHMLHPHNESIGPEPLIIPGIMENWPARKDRPWNKPSYLISRTIGGRRLVPIELGRSYVDNGWGQKILPFQDFLQNYIMKDPSSEDFGIGYLAQHNLFNQIPALRNDICVPDYCFASCSPPHYSSPLSEKHAETPQLEEPLLNAWFGPRGTISPLHTDPYHNILAQVVGRKYIRLYAPRESERVYPKGIEDGGVDMSNTSEVDIGVLAGWDGTEEERVSAHERFPLFGGAEYVECVLEEGECLYIPLGWWHYVRSLSLSFSVSFWFNSVEENEEGN